MEDRWLRSVEDLLMREGRRPDGPFDGRVDEGRWDDGFVDDAAGCEADDLPADDPRRGTLTQVVLLQGQVIDVTHPPVQGSGYECAALELRQLHPSPRPRVERVVVRESPQEEMGRWLQRVVGGETLLAELDVEPLPLSTALTREDVPVQVWELASAVDEHLGRASVGWLVTDEMLTACRRLLVKAAHVGMLRLWRDLEPEKVAAAIVHCAAKANALTGAGAPFTVAHWLRDLGTTSAPASRSSSLARTLGGDQWPHGRSPSGVPDVCVLGDVDLLISRFRRELLAYRDLTSRISVE